MHIFLWAEFGKVGGGQTQALDMVRLWRKHGIELSIIHSLEMASSIRLQLKSLGCEVYCCGINDAVVGIPGIQNSVVIGVCQVIFIQKCSELRGLGCRLGWLNLMTYIGAAEGIAYDDNPLFDCYVFESSYQKKVLTEILSQFGLRSDQSFLVPGPLEIAEWEYAPRARSSDGDFVVGKLARPDICKWSRKTWHNYGMIDHPRRKALLMGINEEMQGWIGSPPDWAKVLPPGAISAQEFYRQIHCLIPFNYAAIENWPRIGLEAMACGVPIVAPKEGGWCDMVIHGETGFLASCPAEFAQYATDLSRDEDFRLRIARQARERLVEELADPDKIWKEWEKVFAYLTR